MVKKWQKQLDLFNKNWNFDLSIIIEDILNNNYSQYDIKKLSWYSNVYRLRIWKNRIIFKHNEEIEILKIDNRWDAYKWI